MSLKILVAGDVEGNMAALFKKVESVNTKAGPFEMLLCVGSFFGPGNLGWNDFKSGRLKVPVPVYILGPNSEEEEAHYPDLDGCELAENIIYLGKQGSFTTNDGLKIAYLSGRQASDPLTAKQFHYSHINLQNMETRLKWDDSKYQGVDILLTSDWPKGIGNRAKPPPPVYDLEIGSPIVSRLALLSRPRYHFCGLQGEFYERAPFRNHQTGTEQARHVTRFLGLAKVGNKEKKKWLYAFNITPLTSMERSELVVQPSGVTEIPFLREHIEIQGEPKQQQFFYDMNAKMEDGDKKGKKRKHESEEGEKKAPAGPCWFCLSSPQVEKHLIVSVGEHTYLALAKGGLNPLHVMILPIGHHQSLVSLPEEVSAEVDKFKSALRKMFKKMGKVPVFFERNFRTQHMQVQVVPVLKDLGHQVKKSFLEIASAQQIDLNEVPGHVALSQLAVQGHPYFYAETPNKEKLFGRISKGFPIQFGREVMASEDLLDMSERVDWKACQISKEEETDMAKEFREHFTPFDFSMD